MEDLIKNIFYAYRKEYGEDAKFEVGETQVFELQDCTVVLCSEDDEIKFTVIQDKIIKCNFSSGLFEAESEE